MTWYLIETLAPAPSASIVFKEGEPRDWTSVRTMTRSDGLDMIEDLIAEVRTSREGLDRVEHGRLGPRRVVMRPVLGYEGEVYGIKT
ncbi:GAF domain-containing protein [Gordonia paraffinivorans]|uniref:GAF domain-containing protein n=1 Tax=Gordonia paraffinivorans TaxID=175628 RepID=UPI0028992559|nr:GAF domain-containing protein [Gordonia paraffinivorans]